MYIEGLCNGSTTGFDPVGVGSTPALSTTHLYAASPFILYLRNDSWKDNTMVGADTADQTCSCSLMAKLLTCNHPMLVQFRPRAPQGYAQRIVFFYFKYEAVHTPSAERSSGI